MIFVKFTKTSWLAGFFVFMSSLSVGVELNGMAGSRTKLNARLEALNRGAFDVFTRDTHKFLHRAVLMPKADNVPNVGNSVQWEHGGQVYLFTETPIPDGADEAKWIEDRRVEVRTELASLDKREEPIYKGVGESISKRAAVEEAFKQFKLFMQDPKALRNTAIFVAAISVLVAAGYFGAKYVYKKAMFNMNRPTLVRESSRLGFLKSLFHSPEEISLNDIVFAPEIEETAYALAEATLQTRELGLPYENILFYGPPGTGKTEFARILAKYSDMDYAIISGADFSQFKKGQGVTEVHKLFEWAKNSKRGLIIFVDEADACFADRSTLDKERIDIVNAFLSHTGGSSDKFMLILATNYDDVLDSAVRSRMHKKLEFNLPGEQERYRIFMLKLDKYIMNYMRKYEKDGMEVEEAVIVDSALNTQFWKDIAAKTEGFSGRDIDYAVQSMRRDAIMSGNNMLTQKIVDRVITNKAVGVEKDKRVVEKQRKLFQARTGVAVAA